MSRKRKPRQEPARCSCFHTTDTPEWSNKRGRHAGMTTRGGANHGNPFTHKDGCIHSELSLTTKSAKNRNVVPRIRLK